MWWLIQLTQDSNFAFNFCNNYVELKSFFSYVNDKISYVSHPLILSKLLSFSSKNVSDEFKLVHNFKLSVARPGENWIYVFVTKQK